MAAKKQAKKKREVTVMMSVRVPPELEQRAKVAARHNGCTLQQFVRTGIHMALGDT